MSRLLKAELHIHINLDPEDIGEIKYSAKDLIDSAAEKDFQVLAITCHNWIYRNPEMEKYAWSKGIILLSGAELTIRGKHVLVYNLSEEERKSVKSFEDLLELKQKNKDIFVIAPHPFHFGFCCLGRKIIEYLDLFDAWEYSFFYLNWFNLNKRTVRLAKKFGKKLVANSDVHDLRFLGKTYTLIDARLDKKSVFEALRKGRVEIGSEPLNFSEFFFISLMILRSTIRRAILKTFKSQSKHLYNNG